MNLNKKAWNDFVYGHPSMQIAQACLENVSPQKFWSISEQHPDLVSRLHIQTRLMGNFGLNGGIPWLSNTDGAACFLCKLDIETVNQFLLDCPNFREHFDSLWADLTVKVTKFNFQVSSSILFHLILQVYNITKIKTIQFQIYI